MPIRPMSNQNVNRNNQTPPNAASHSTQQPPQRQQQQPGMPTQVRPQANTQSIAASQRVPGSNAQNNVNRRGNVDTSNLSKAQRKRLRQRLAKERRKAEAAQQQS